MPPPPPYPSWILRGLGGEPLLVQTFDAPRDPAWEVLDPMFVLGYLERWLEDPASRALLLDIHATLFGALDATTWALGEERRWLRPELRLAFERLDLIVLIERGLSSGPPRRPTPIPPSPKPGPPQKEKTFIEIVLLDQDGKPVAGERFVITLPDGAKVNGNLDAKGFKRVDGIDPGTCDVEFPDIDGREWGPRPLSS